MLLSLQYRVGGCVTKEADDPISHPADIKKYDNQWQRISDFFQLFSDQRKFDQECFYENY